MSAGDRAGNERFQRAVEFFQRQDIAGAEALCAEILAGLPDDVAALGLAGAAALVDGKPLLALDRLRHADRVGPPSYNVLSGLGSAYMQLQRFAEAADAFGRALELRPDLTPARRNLAGACRTLGEYDRAIALLAPLAAADQADEALLLELGSLFLQVENLAAGITIFRKALATAPQSLSARQGLAYALKRAGRTAEALEHYRHIVDALPGDAAAQIELGVALAATGAADDAIAVLRRALVLAPQDKVARAALGQLFRDRVPAWHFTMLNDAPRNDAYRAAIERAVKPGSVVLDIGTGSGLLAMMAARAGAAHVYACEVQPIIAEKAREIVRANGFADRITIIAKNSQQLRIGQDLPRKADVLVSEIVDTALIGEGILLTLTHALRELVAEGAAIIPRGAVIKAMLVESEALHRQDRVDHAAGFDVGAFNEFSRYSFRDVDLRQFPHRPLSEPVELFRFDFTRPLFRPEAKALTIRASAPGICHALVTWFEMALDDEIAVSSAPTEAGLHWHWMQEAHLWDTPRALAAGESMSVAASHDLIHVHIVLDGV